MNELLQPESVTHAILVLSLVAFTGLMLGSIRVRGIGLGVAGVFFSGLAFGHFKVTIDPRVLEFAREFGLVLFVYTIGVQVGPSFFGSLRSNGLRLNLMAAAVVILGALLTAAVAWFGGIQGPIAVGLFSGATTSTPSLGAAQQALKEIPGLDPGVANLPGLGYAVAYPFGIIGVIFSMLGLKRLFGVHVPSERIAFEAASAAGKQPELELRNFEIRNPNLEGLPIRKVPVLAESGVLITRVLHEGHLQVAQADTVLHVGDTVLAIGKRAGLEKLRILIGIECTTDLQSLPSPIVSRKLLVTRKNVSGRTPRQLDFFRKYGVTLTRVVRAGLEFAPTSNFALQFGDQVVAIGEAPAIDKVAEELGNAGDTLNHPQVIPIFIGLALGVIVGSLSVNLPGTPTSLKLGLAGGPLIVAILLSRLGQVRSLVWYMPVGATSMLRELGILLFLSCVGLKSGAKFLETLIHGGGWVWIGYAALITVIPILIVGACARRLLKLNFLSICGLLAGSMTDTAALVFATSIAGSQAPSISYATVYPMTMLLRVIAAQFLVFVLT